MENVTDTLEVALNDYNEMNVSMNLVLFGDAVGTCAGFPGSS